MTVKGFEPLPQKRLVPLTSAIDHSAKLSLLVLFPKVFTQQILHGTLLDGNSCFFFLNVGYEILYYLNLFLYL